MVPQPNLMNTLSSSIQPAECFNNIGELLCTNAEKFAGRPVFQFRNAAGVYEEISWKQFYQDILNISWNLSKLGFRKADRMLLFSRNRLEMLQLELAVMACGGVAIPIFAHFKKPTSDLLIGFSDATWLAVEGESQMAQISRDQMPGNIISLSGSQLSLHGISFIEFFQLKQTAPQGYIPGWDADPNSICLCMYTSGTMDIPKLVQLTHQNILSQQAAIKNLLHIDEQDRFLSYLPWHHSFGGIFELFSALANGASYAVESSYGKDVAEIVENWKQVKPTVFFSVPRIYQALSDMARQDSEAEKLLFGGGLKFIFTAAAALPPRLSDEFEKRKIPVIEGWGLTETSPCCTLTNPTLERCPGVVGMPIPGVMLRLDEEGEILVKGPNVMAGYYKNEEANKRVFTNDGWFRTGDVGEITGTGLKLVSRKDRIFKLSNGEKVIPTDLETAIQKQCHYVQYVLVTGNGADYPVALIFPNKKLLEQSDFLSAPEEGCSCPKNMGELGRCLSGCLKIANENIHQKFAKLKSAALIPEELSIDDNTLTPSLKMAPRTVMEKYREQLKKLYGDSIPAGEEIYVMEL